MISEKERVEVKEWGSPVSNDEIFYLRDLEDFISSDLLQGTTTSSSKRTKHDRPTAEPEPKRRKINTGSLYHVIPQVRLGIPIDHLWI